MAKVVRFYELGDTEVLRLEEITFDGPICRSRSNTATDSRGFRGAVLMRFQSSRLITRVLWQALWRSKTGGHTSEQPGKGRSQIGTEAYLRQLSSRTSGDSSRDSHRDSKGLVWMIYGLPLPDPER